MTRKFIIVVLIALFAWPTLAMAQTPDSSAQVEESVNTRSTVSLTTTDLLSSQDFAPKTVEPPAKRARAVNAAKKAKTEDASFTQMPVTQDKVVAKVQQEIGKLLDVGANTMQPTQPLIETRSDENVVAVSTSTGSRQVDTLVAAAAQRHGVDQHLIMALMRQESSFNPRATSYKGARGLMQLMPATAARFGVTDIYDPAQNIEGGTRYLRFLLDTFNGDVELALAGYNAGEGAVARYGNRIPPYRETQDYVRKISAHYARLSNGTYVRRNTSSYVMEETKKSYTAEPLTVGTTMTQY